MTLSEVTHLQMSSLNVSRLLSNCNDELTIKNHSTAVPWLRQDALVHWLLPIRKSTWKHMLVFPWQLLLNLCFGPPQNERLHCLNEHKAIVSSLSFLRERTPSMKTLPLRETYSLQSHWDAVEMIFIPLHHQKIQVGLGNPWNQETGKGPQIF